MLASLRSTAVTFSLSLLLVSGVSALYATGCSAAPADEEVDEGAGAASDVRVAGTDFVAGFYDSDDATIMLRNPHGTSIEVRYVAPNEEFPCVTTGTVRDGILSAPGCKLTIESKRSGTALAIGEGGTFERRRASALHGTYAEAETNQKIIVTSASDRDDHFAFFLESPQSGGKREFYEAKEGRFRDRDGCVTEATVLREAKRFQILLAIRDVTSGCQQSERLFE